LNQVRNPALDKSNTTNTKQFQKSQLTIDALDGELGVVDVWRLLYPQDREYAVYSSLHATYSRVDYFLISKPLVGMTVNASIGNIV